MTEPSAKAKAIARAAAAAFGGLFEVYHYWDDPHVRFVDILSCKDSPQTGVTSHATIGASDAPLVIDGKELDVRAELVGACDSRVSDFPNYLATAAFNIINSRRPVAPGIIFPGVLSMYQASTTMEHFLFLPPFLWDQRLQTLHIEQTKVAWLLAIPISEGELRFALSKGVPALEVLFAKHQIDIYNLHRPSVV